jgi:hypothetical protein
MFEGKSAMAANFRDDYEKFRAEYQQQVARIGETQQRLADISCTAVAPRRAISVTVGHGGVITEISFPTGAYKRMTPNELAAALINTINDARDQAVAAAGEILAPSLPEGVDPRALLTGRFDLRSLMPAARAGLSQQTRDLLAARDQEMP